MKIDIKNIPNNIIIAFVAIIVVAVFIGIAFIYIPFNSNTKEVRSKISAEKNKNALIGRINSLERRLDFYKKRTLDAKDSSWMLGEISRIVKEEGIEVSSIEKTPLEEKDLYTKLGVALDVYATYHKLGKFLSKVESEEKFFRVESLNMKRIDADEDFSNLKEKFKPFDVKANIIISTVVLK